MVTPTGFEPSITGLRVLRPDQLDEGARAAPTRSRDDDSCGNTALSASLKDEDIVNLHPENSSQHHKIVHCG